MRGVAGADLTCELAMKIGRGAAAVLTGSTGHRPRKMCIRDRYRTLKSQKEPYVVLQGQPKCAYEANAK